MKDLRIYLAHILECLQRIESYVANGKDAFFSEPMIQDAVIRNFEVIGEAAKRVPDKFRVANPAVPWSSLAGFRDVLIHQYEGVSLPRVWRAIENDLPRLKSAIAALLPPLEQLEKDISGES